MRHCHLEPRDYADVPAVLGWRAAAGWCTRSWWASSRRPGDFGHALEVAGAHPDFLSPTLGIHPHEAARATEEDFARAGALCARPEVRAVGEAGLDYYYDRSPREVQARSSGASARWRERLGKPLVVHVRDAHEDCEAILREEGIRRGVIHCFTGDTAAARRYLDLGLPPLPVRAS